MPDRDFYQTLGVARSASQDDIKKAYRKLAKELHPDRNPGNKTAEDRFKEVSYAYDILSDDKKKPLYDEFGEVALKEGFDQKAYREYQQWQKQGGGRRVQWGGRHPGGPVPGGVDEVNLEDLLGGMGGGGFGVNIGDLFGQRGGARGRPRRGADVQAAIRMSFVDALRGGERELGYHLEGEPTPRTIKVRIPPGASEGDKVRLRGQGGRPPQNGGDPGDLVLEIHVEPHPFLRREGDDLHLDLPVKASEAYSGAKVPVPTLDGEVTLRIPPGTQSGAKLRLRGKGAPKRGGGAGDMIVEISIRLPPAGDDKIARALEETDSAMPDPRADIKL